MPRHRNRMRRQNRVEPVAVATLPVIQPTTTVLLDPHHSRADLRMAGRAAREGWMKGTRWPTDATDQDFVEMRKQRPLSIKERAALAALKGLSSDEPRVVQAAVKSVVAMEAQNQADELKQPRRHRPSRPATNTLVIVEGNLGDAKRELTERIARLAGNGNHSGRNQGSRETDSGA